jgi:hypothetical protein
MSGRFAEPSRARTSPSVRSTGEKSGRAWARLTPGAARRLAVTAVAAWLAASSLAFAGRDDASSLVVGPEQIGTLVSLENVQTQGGTVSGQIVNRSDGTVSEVRLLVRDAFMWRDERNPGEDNPGRSQTLAVDVVVPPYGSAPFSIERDPLPDRDDGRFLTAVLVMGVTWDEQPTPP